MPRDRDIAALFSQRFSTPRMNPTELFTLADLDRAETALATTYPDDYRDFAMRFGSLYTPSILDVIEEAEDPFPDLQEFWKPDQLINDTQLCWSGGMPQNVVAFASDCMGNAFCFPRSLDPMDETPVLFFDHDYMSVTEIAPTFTAWLAWYLDNLPSVNP